MWVIVDNSFCRICRRRALRRLACEGRRSASSHGESLRSTNCSRLRFHDLRHVAATVMLTLGVQVRVVMETLGHSQISTTMDRYSQDPHTSFTS